MARDITDALAEWVAKQPARRRHDAQAVAFLAVRTDVVKALEAGYSIKTIWAFLKDQGRITSSYEMFRRHTQRHIKKALSPHLGDQAKGEKSAQQERGPKVRKPKAPEPRISKSAGIPGFTFNPTPNKEDLI